MNIKLELLKGYIFDYIDSHIQDFSVDADKIADTAALRILSDVKNYVCNDELSDFELVEEIVKLFEANGIYCGGRHDFG